LTAKRAFAGDTLTDVFAAVLEREPDWTKLPAATPPPVRELLERCFVKDSRQRLRDIGEARLLLRGAPLAAESEARATRGARSGRALPWILCAALAVLLVLASSYAFGLFGPVAPRADATARGPLRVSIALPVGVEIGAQKEVPVAISPDGSRIVFVGLSEEKTRLYLRPLGAAEATVIAGTEGARSPFFSPDGQWIAFFAQGKLKKITVGGTALETLADATSSRGGAWGVDDAIYFVPTNASGVWKVPATGGPATEVTHLARESGEISHRWPELLPDGKTLLYSAWTGPGSDERHIVRQTLGGPERDVLVTGGGPPRYFAPGFLCYGGLDTLFAAPWTPEKRGLGGVVPLALPEPQRQEGEGASAYALSRNGTLAYLPGGPSRRLLRVMRIDAKGAAEPLPLPERDYHSIALSPDGRRAIVQLEDGIVGLWMLDFARGTLTPFAVQGGSSQAPIWTPDGLRVIYRGTRSGFRNLFWRYADGTGEEQRLTTKPDVIQTPTSISPDARWLVFNEEGKARNGSRAWVLSLGTTPFAAAGEPAEIGNGSDGQISPDGRWLAFHSSVSGRGEVYLQPFPGPGPLQPVSVEGGQCPRWARDGSELYFTTRDALMAVTISAGAEPAIGEPRLLFEGRFRESMNDNTPYDVTADGHFLRVQLVEAERAMTSIELVLGWSAQLEPNAR
jgi:serine/threonine-protein kinase